MKTENLSIPQYVAIKKALVARGLMNYEEVEWTEISNGFVQKLESQNATFAAVIYTCPAYGSLVTGYFDEKGEVRGLNVIVELSPDVVAACLASL